MAGSRRTLLCSAQSAGFHSSHCLLLAACAVMLSDVMSLFCVRASAVGDGSVELRTALRLLPALSF